MITNYFKQEGIQAVKLIAAAFLAAIIVIYGAYESYAFISGPSLSVTAPIDGSSLTDSLIQIEGSTKRISKMTINDRQIFLGDDGLFREPLLLGNGYNIIKVSVEDQFGRQITKKIRVVLE